MSQIILFMKQQKDTFFNELSGSNAERKSRHWCEKGAQISVVAKKIVTQGWSEIMIMKYKEATH